MTDSYDEQTILAYIEGDLSPDEAHAYKLSMLKDAKLRRLVEQLIADRTALRQLPIEPVPIALVEQVEEYLERDMLLGPSVPAAVAGPSPALDQPGPRSISPVAVTPGGGMKRWSMAAMAAVLLIGVGLLVFKAQYPPKGSDQPREVAFVDAPRDDSIRASKAEATVGEAKKSSDDDEAESDVQSEMVEDRDATKSKQGLELLTQDLERILAGTIGFDDDATAAAQDVETEVVKDAIVATLPGAFDDRRLALASHERDTFKELTIADKQAPADDSSEEPEQSPALAARVERASTDLLDETKASDELAAAPGPDAAPAASVALEAADSVAAIEPVAPKQAMGVAGAGTHPESDVNLAAKPGALAADQAVALAKDAELAPRNLTLIISSDHTGKSIAMIRSWTRLHKASWVRKQESSKAKEVRRKLGAPDAGSTWRTASRDARTRAGALSRHAPRTAEKATREQRWTLRIRPAQLDALLAHIKSAKDHKVERRPALTTPKKATPLKSQVARNEAASSVPRAARALSADIKPAQPLPPDSTARITVTVIIQQRTPPTSPAKQQPRKNTDRKRGTQSAQP
jgi:hypothetical protein